MTKAKAKQVFISHAKEDAQFAHRLADDLRRLGVQVWIAPESIHPGESWVDAIERGLEESSHTVSVLTPKALKSRWVKKETEVAIAQERKGRIQVIPLDVDPCAVPLLLSSYQMVSFRQDYDAGLSQLATILSLRVTPPKEETISFWRKVPLWVWGAVGGLILLAVVGRVLLAGRGPKATPAPAPIAEVPTPVVSDLSYSPNELLPGEAVAIWVNVAVADQNTPVAYTWSTEGGKIMRGQGTAAIIYKAPDTPDTYGVSLKIEYGDWDTERSASIIVASPTPTPTPLPPTDTPMPVLLTQTPLPLTDTPPPVPPTDMPLPPTPTVTLVPPTAAPIGGGRIAFASDRNGNEEIHVMNSDGSGQTRLTNNPAYDEDPSWSPDGTLIAFTSKRDGNAEIYVMNADGSEVTRLTNNPAYEADPSWSPDGTRIAYTAVPLNEANWEIYVMNADGSGVTRLTNNSDWDGEPCWSPDSTRIAFRSWRDGNTEIYVMNADGSRQTNLTNHPARDTQFSWSPDGTHIAFTSDRDGNYEIYVMNADGSGVTRLTNNSDWDSEPCWSPDSTRIAFRSWRDSNSEIYVMNADGSGVTRLTDNPATDWSPSWGP